MYFSRLYFLFYFRNNEFIIIKISKLYNRIKHIIEVVYLLFGPLNIDAYSNGMLHIIYFIVNKRIYLQY